MTDGISQCDIKLLENHFVTNQKDVANLFLFLVNLQKKTLHLVYYDSVINS